MTKIKVESNGPGRADLFVDGGIVGTVLRVEQYYNIAPRPLTVHYWRLFIDGYGQVSTHFRLRRDAVEAAEGIIERKKIS
jgi:hypothetical protein